MKTPSLTAAFLLPLVLAWAPLAPAAATKMATTLFVDATDAPRNLLHVEETIVVAPGPLTLFYPKWLPGSHRPDGPVIDLVGLHISANDTPVSWRRDAVEMNALHLEVPTGANELNLRFDFILAPPSGAQRGSRSASAQLAVINWNQVVLYPLDAKPDALMVAARLRVPDGWSHATALRTSGQDATLVQFAPVSLTTLVDSPVLLGAHFSRLELTPAGDRTPVFLNIAADSQAALAIEPDMLAAYRRLVLEARALFGATHYTRYELLYALSDHVAHLGLEHHESSDNRTPEMTLIDEKERQWWADLLPHEYAHSWNGKFRRPAGLATGDFSTPSNDELLWVYEGLTQYLGFLLTTRSDLWSADEARGVFASVAAKLDARPGRTWRPLQDTADAAPILYGTRPDYDALRRNAGDFYDEGALIWLEADVTIRELTGGAKSLDDFCRAFFGPPSGPPTVIPYTADDVYAALNAVAAHDWRAFFSNRLQSLNSRGPFGGVERGGWRLVFRDTPTTHSKSQEDVRKQTDVRFSLGMLVKADGADAGAIIDVIPGTPAAQAGLAPGMKMIAVNGRRYSPELLERALKESVTSTAPIEVLAENREFFSTHRLDYRGGERYPHLERDPSKPDVLGQIFAPLVPPAQS